MAQWHVVTQSDVATVTHCLGGHLSQVDLEPGIISKALKAFQNIKPFNVASIIFIYFLFEIETRSTADSEVVFRDTLLQNRQKQIKGKNMPKTTGKA